MLGTLSLVHCRKGSLFAPANRPPPPRRLVDGLSKPALKPSGAPALESIDLHTSQNVN